MNANPELFRALQWFGAAYLCWMGLQLLRTRLAGDAARTEPRKSASVHFRQALAVSLTNPKVVLFFVSFFPLFLKPSASGTTLAVMMLHVTLLSLLYQSMLAVAGNAAARKLRSISAARQVATRLAGTALIGFGIKLASDNR
jgi:threonine/homoserine/homoserine lactone efflux protein